MTISTFYISTKAAFDVWIALATAPAPPRVDTFPTTLHGLAYYFEFSRATRSITFQVNVRDHSGALVYIGVRYSLTLESCATCTQMIPFFHSFAPGTYTAHLRINGHPIRSTTFTVAPTVPLPTISSFYATTKAAYDGWDGTRPLPRVSTFPAHTEAVGFYFAYSGGSGSGSAQVYIRDHSGNIVVVSSVMRTSNEAGGWGGSLTVPLTGGYSPGTYTMSLLINGRAVRKSAIFTVQPPAPAATPTSPPPTATPTPQPPTPTATPTPHA
jgi:hypothetical protein